jgi:hypothetical protein
VSSMADLRVYAQLAGIGNSTCIPSSNHQRVPFTWSLLWEGSPFEVPSAAFILLFSSILEVGYVGYHGEERWSMTRMGSSEWRRQATAAQSVKRVRCTGSAATNRASNTCSHSRLESYSLLLGSCAVIRPGYSDQCLQLPSNLGHAYFPLL